MDFHGRDRLSDAQLWMHVTICAHLATGCNSGSRNLREGRDNRLPDKKDQQMATGALATRYTGATSSGCGTKRKPGSE